MAHPLDRPVWAALTGRMAHLAIADGPACRLDPAVGIWAAAADGSDASVAALLRLRAAGALSLLESDAGDVPGPLVTAQASVDQRVFDHDTPTVPDVGAEPLGEADAPAMLALAALTRPGPFLSGTVRCGGFVGVKVDGVLVAMAGERLRPPGHAEVSGVCTHSDHRGRGLAAALIRTVAAGIVARGETPFIHSYSSNTGANALYERLGFRFRRVLTQATIG